MLPRITAVGLRLILLSSALVAQTVDLNTTLMECTVKVGGPARPPNVGMTIGTAFIIGKPMPLSSQTSYVLVSAAHVLDEVAGEDLHVVWRKKEPDGSYVVAERLVLFRAGERNLYVKHPTLDIAALYVSLPPGVAVPLLSLDWLATEDQLKSLGIHPNEEFTALGYPLGESANEWEFPILRSGKLASYPITPLSLVKTFLFDFRVFEGNSGGPVYLYAPNSRFTPLGQLPLGGYVQTIVGLVSEQKYTNRERLAQPGVSKLDFGVILPAQFIRDTIELLHYEPPSNRLMPRVFPMIFNVRK